jgi:hypothetical protein
MVYIYICSLTQSRSPSISIGNWAWGETLDPQNFGFINGLVNSPIEQNMGVYNLY